MLQILLLIRDYRAILLWPYRYSIYLTSQSPSTINQQLNTTNVCGDNGLNATFLLSQRNGRKEAGRHTPDLACVCPLLHPHQSRTSMGWVTSMFQLTKKQPDRVVAKVKNHSLPQQSRSRPRMCATSGTANCIASKFRVDRFCSI